MQKTDNRLMKARELRVGSVIAYCTHPVVIETIGKNTLGFTYIDKSISTNFEREINGINFKPIPLTPEILEAAGFVKEYQNPTHISYGADNPKIGVYYFKDGSTPMFRYISEKNIPCQYLHQLQNLIFALTGSELPMTFKNKI